MKQLGFDLDYTDPLTMAPVPWAAPTDALLALIRNAAWKVFDTETTGLNPASKEQNFSNKDFQRGVRTDLRVRICSVLIPAPAPSSTPTLEFSFDLDPLSEKEKTAVAIACFSKVVFAHNAGFDAFWVRTLSREAAATRVVDSMLLARVLRPEHPLVMARMSQDESEDPELRDAALAMFQQRRSGWSLADLSVGVLRQVLEKDSQGPKNWCQPFLTQKNYDYAVGDVVTVHTLLLALLEVEPGTDLLEAYLEEAQKNSVLRMVEPQVNDILHMRELGMPWSVSKAKSYISKQHQKVRVLSAKLCELEPTLAPYLSELSDPSKGTGAALKEVMGAAFISRGIEPQLTGTTGAYKVGEKDLRRVRAASSAESQELFAIWVGINRAKKAAGMAQEVTRYALASPDGRLHPNTGHGPVTGRLSSSEPNCQQFPGDPEFRAAVSASDLTFIAASDYSALDMRVGAALAIRAQLRIIEAYQGKRSVPLDVLRVLQRVIDKQVSMDAASAQEARATLAFKNHRRPPEDVDGMVREVRTKYWEVYRKLARTQKLAHFQRCLCEVRRNADADGTETWGSLRNAFAIPGMDIHTWTALGMLGQEPQKLFAGLSDEDVAIRLKEKKHEIGDHRKTGKVGNLSLLYAMKPMGLQEAAAKNYDIHWTLPEAEKVFTDWLATYVEIDLWHIWTELTPMDTVRVPDPEKGNRIVKKDVFSSQTLGNRTVIAFGLNAALSYEDQSSGADILGRVMQTFREDYPHVFESVINQVHDEVVFEIPRAESDEYIRVINRVMTDCAEFFLSPYGVKGECSQVVGDVWLKD